MILSFIFAEIPPKIYYTCCLYLYSAVSFVLGLEIIAMKCFVKTVLGV
jgi:hypothetical protein